MGGVEGVEQVEPGKEWSGQASASSGVLQTHYTHTHRDLETKEQNCYYLQMIQFSALKIKRLNAT